MTLKKRITTIYIPEAAHSFFKERGFCLSKLVEKLLVEYMIKLLKDEGPK